MACTFKYLEDNFRNNNPEEADRLTELGIDTWRTIKDSKQFSLNNKNEYKFSKKGTKQRNRQDTIIKPFIEEHGKFIYENNGEVRVNLLIANKVGLQPFQLNGVDTKIKESDIPNKSIAHQLGIYDKEISEEQKINIKKNVKTYNNKNNTSLFVEFNPVGEANLNTWKIVDKSAGQLSLFESKKNLSNLTTPSTKDQFGKTKEEFNEEEVRYEFSEEIKNAIFAGTPGNITAKEAIKNILSTGIYPQGSKMYELLHRMLISTKATIKIVDSKDMKSNDTYMQYNTVNQTVEVALDNLGDVSSIEEGISKFVHEVFHDRTLRILRIPKNSSEQQLYNDIKSIYDVLKPLLEEQFPHEMSSIEEFTAGMFSNKEFEQTVENLIDTKTNFWDKIVNFFKNLFNLDSEYNKLINKLMSLVDITDETYIGEDILESRYNIGKTTAIKKSGLESINNVIDKTLQDLENTTKRLKLDNKFTEKLKNTKEQIELLLDKYDKTSDEYRLESIRIFNSFMNGQLIGSIKKLESTADFNSRLYEQINTYNNTFISLQKEIKVALKELKNNNTLSQEDYKKELDIIDNISKSSLHLQDTLYDSAKEEILHKNDLFSEQYKDVELKYEAHYRQEGRKLGLVKYDLDEYVNKKLSENRDKIRKESKDEFNDLISSPINDISNISAALNSEKDFTNPIIRIFSRILDNVKHQYQNRIQPVLLDIQTETNKFLEGKRVTSSDENYKNLVEWSNEDEVFLLNDYKIGYRDSFISLVNELNDEKFGENLTDDEKVKLKKTKFKNWFQANTVKDEFGISHPHPKWKNDLSKLTQKERDYLSYIKKIAKESDENYGLSVKSLKKTTLGISYYQLPSQHKELITHLKKGNPIETFKEVFNDNFKLRTDDTTMGELTTDENNKTKYMVYTDISGKEIKYVPIHHRNKIDKQHQSIDLATLYALEFQNSVKFNEKTKVHSDLKMFIDVIQENGFIKTQGLGQRVISSFTGKQESTPVIYNKENSNLLKQLETMLNNRLYDKTSQYAGKIGNADVAKIENFIRGTVSKTSMALNLIGAPVNLIIGKSQTILEVIRDPNLTMTNIKNAEKFFFNNIGSTIDDLGRNVYKSLPNQLLMSYGGLVTSEMLQNNFEKNKTLALANTKPLYFLQEGGEHWIQAIHTMTILDSAKILDKDGNYLDKNGNITTKDKAASILDITVLKNGYLSTSITTPFYTTIDRMKAYQQGGDATIRSYIQSSLIKTQGQYSKEYQSELQRTVLGKALFHFKKHILSPGLSRWRGAGTNIFAKPEDVILNYESDLLRPDEGNYVTFLRFIIKTAIPKIAKLELNLITKEWNEMDEWEKGNIKRALSEIALINIAASSAILFAGAASQDDDEFWYAAAVARRIQSDSAQYYNINEAWRTIQNPISTLKFLQTSTSFLGSVTNYISPFAENRNEKFIKSSKKMSKYIIPGYAIFNKAKDQYQWNAN